MTELWTHQEQGIADCGAAVARGYRSIVLYSPTGGGKTRIIAEMAKRAAAKAKKVLIYTNRRILLGQGSEALRDHGVSHGILAAGHQVQVLPNVQVASIMTVHSRVSSERWTLPEADLVLVDEAHSNAGPTASKIIRDHRDSGAVVIGFTATPIGLAHLYTTIVQAGTYSGLRDAGVLLPCEVFAPSEPDMQGLSLSNKGEYSNRAMSKRVEQSGVFGDIWGNWIRLNEERKPTAVFAPSVAHSKWVVENIFEANGVAAAHIDGETPEDEREAIFDGIASGRLTVVSSCGVLREGWNCPEIAHGVLLQVCGGLGTYLQIVGRLLRRPVGSLYHPVRLQDHTGAWHRHGPPDIDRDWELDDTNKSVAKERKERLKKGEEEEGICCPKCNGVRAGGRQCPHCGHQHVKSNRMVRQTDGTLKRMQGPVVGKAVKKKRDLRGHLYGAVNGRKTFNQFAAQYRREHGTNPPAYLFPNDRADWHRLVKDHVDPRSMQFYPGGVTV